MKAAVAAKNAARSLRMSFPFTVMFSLLQVVAAE
jgi:hypothetical protein